MSGFQERFYVYDATPEGVALLECNYPLQIAMEQYVEAPAAHLAPVPEARFIGGGNYSRVYNFNDELALKFSNWETVSVPLRRIGRCPEDLREQFAVLSAMKEHLYYKREDITTPEQYFVSHPSHDNFILAQELMTGWVPLADRMEAIYGRRAEDWETVSEIEAWTDSFHRRAYRSFGDFALTHLLTDMIRDDGRFHGGNVLVPFDAPLNEDTPLCIIDQPGVMSG